MYVLPASFYLLETGNKFWYGRQAALAALVLAPSLQSDRYTCLALAVIDNQALVARLSLASSFWPSGMTVDKPKLLARQINALDASILRLSRSPSKRM